MYHLGCGYVMASPCMFSAFLVILTIGYTAGTCTFPSDLRGTWISSAKSSLTFNSTHITGYNVYNQGNLAFSCDLTSGDYYILKSEEFTLFSSPAIAVMCFKFIKVKTSLYKYSIFTAMLTDAGNQRIRFTSNTTSVTESLACTDTAVTDYSLLMEDGQIDAVKEQCPDDILGTFAFSFNNSDCSNSTGSLDVCSNLNMMTFNYTSCSTVQAYSSGGEVYCVYSTTSGDITTLNVYNPDNNTDETTYYKFTCYTIEKTSSSSYVYATQHPQDCHVNQTSTYAPGPGANLTMLASVTCVPTTTTEAVSVSQAGLIAGIAAGLIVLLLLLLLCIGFCIYKKKTKVEPAGKAPIDTESNGQQQEATENATSTLQLTSDTLAVEHEQDPILNLHAITEASTNLTDEQKLRKRSVYASIIVKTNRNGSPTLLKRNNGQSSVRFSVANLKKKTSNKKQEQRSKTKFKPAATKKRLPWPALFLPPEADDSKKKETVKKTDNVIMESPEKSKDASVSLELVADEKDEGNAGIITASISAQNSPRENEIGSVVQETSALEANEVLDEIVVLDKSEPSTVVIVDETKSTDLNESNETKSNLFRNESVTDSGVYSQPSSAEPNNDTGLMQSNDSEIHEATMIQNTDNRTDETKLGEYDAEDISDSNHAELAEIQETQTYQVKNDMDDPNLPEERSSQHKDVLSVSVGLNNANTESETINVSEDNDGKETNTTAIDLLEDNNERYNTIPEELPDNKQTEEELCSIKHNADGGPDVLDDALIALSSTEAKESHTEDKAVPKVDDGDDKQTEIATVRAVTLSSKETELKEIADILPQIECPSWYEPKHDFVLEKGNSDYSIEKVPLPLNGKLDYLNKEGSASNKKKRIRQRRLDKQKEEKEKANSLKKKEKESDEKHMSPPTDSSNSVNETYKTPMDTEQVDASSATSVETKGKETGETNDVLPQIQANTAQVISKHNRHPGKSNKMKKQFSFLPTITNASMFAKDFQENTDTASCNDDETLDNTHDKIVHQEEDSKQVTCPKLEPPKPDSGKSKINPDKEEQHLKLPDAVEKVKLKRVSHKPKTLNLPNLVSDKRHSAPEFRLPTISIFTDEDTKEINKRPFSERVTEQTLTLPKGEDKAMVQGNSNPAWEDTNDSKTSTKKKTSKKVRKQQQDDKVKPKKTTKTKENPTKKKRVRKGNKVTHVEGDDDDDVDTSKYFNDKERAGHVRPGDKDDLQDLILRIRETTLTDFTLPNIHQETE